MRFVYERTTIPIPRVYRVWGAPDDSCIGWIAMDYIHGQRLDHVWSSLSLWKKLHISWLLRSYVRQLRKIKDPRSLVPGPLGSTPRYCPGMVISSLTDQGPFPDSAALTAFMNQRSQSISNAEVPKKFREPEPLFFTHNDINMRNVILGHDSLVWLIDWDFSGFYPRFFEFADMKLAAEYFSCPPAPLSWRRCIPFIADPYFERYRWAFGHP
jgi:hypothetical protein